MSLCGSLQTLGATAKLRKQTELIIVYRIVKIAVCVLWMNGVGGGASIEYDELRVVR